MMTNVRRLLSSGFLAPCCLSLMIGGLFTGCSTTGPYSAGRLPYGGDQKSANHDPFAGVSQEKHTASADRANGSTAPVGSAGQDLVSWNQNRATTPDDYSAPPAGGSNWSQNAAPQATHQAAYFDQTAGGGFASPPPSSQALQMPQPTYGSPPMTAVADESNPFAVVAGSPAATTPVSAPVNTGLAGSMRPAAPTGDAWYTESTSQSSTGEVFLPPIR